MNKELKISIFSGKRVLVTGGTGMIGRYLVEELLRHGAQITVASLDLAQAHIPGVEFIRTNLLHLESCLKICKGQQFVFHVAGIKGSPAMTQQKPASFFTSLILMNTNMMEAARASGVESYLFTSSVGVYAPAEIFYEDSVWESFPSPNDRFAGWAKRMGELQAQAYAQEFAWDKVSIVRPANVYGRFDNFDPKNAMVIPSLMHRIASGENPLRVWGDGSAVRDFIHAKDVALGMIHMLEHGVREPVNLGSGSGISIRELVEVLAETYPGKKPTVEWDSSKPAGDKMRVFDIARAKKHGFSPRISLLEGLQDTWVWYLKNHSQEKERFNVFRQGIPHEL